MSDEVYLLESEKELQRILTEHPSVKARLALLLNGYRELLRTSMEAMSHGETDIADIWGSCAKKDAMLEAVGIPILSTQDDWMRARELV
jgi:hypothetical protein